MVYIGINMISLTNQDLEKAKNLLLAGDVVAIPTETVYGLAADIKNEAAIRKVFSLKERPFFDPLIVHVSNLKQAKSLTTEWTPLTDFLARSFWPGPLTLILPKASHVNPLITSGLETVAIRFPNHTAAIHLISEVGPLAAPSANKFGHTSPTEAHHVRNEFKEPSVFVLDGGPCEIGIESTVIEVSPTQDSISILRPGGVGVLELEAALKKWSHPVSIKRLQSQKSPGHTPHHYVPILPFVLLVKSEKIQDLKSILPLAIDIENGVELKLSNEPEQAARELYSQLRLACQAPSTQFIYYCISNDQLHDSRWDAIFDRIQRASEFKTKSAKLALQF